MTTKPINYLEESSRLLTQAGISHTRAVNHYGFTIDSTNPADGAEILVSGWGHRFRVQILTEDPPLSDLEEFATQDATEFIHHVLTLGMVVHVNRFQRIQLRQETDQTEYLPDDQEGLLIEWDGGWVTLPLDQDELHRARAFAEGNLGLGADEYRVSVDWMDGKILYGYDEEEEGS